MDHQQLVMRDEEDAELPRAHLFVLRLWKVERPAGPEYRGNVRDVAAGAWRNFHDWSDAQAFMIEQMDEYEREQAPRADGGDA
jgi:hypothetical protein